MLLQALVLEAEERMEGHGESPGREAAFFEVTIASVDQPKLLSRLSEALVRAAVNSGWLCCAGLDVLLGGCGMAQLLVQYCVAQLGDFQLVAPPGCVALLMPLQQVQRPLSMP